MQAMDPFFSFADLVKIEPLREGPPLGIVMNVFPRASRIFSVQRKPDNREQSQRHYHS
jgi:hypothetical protein